MTFACALYAVQAKVVLPKVLCSNMVLQQQSEVNLWGKAEPKYAIDVTVSWSDKTYRAVADKNGDWQVKVATPIASFEKQSITISDGEALVLENILIGDVWICAGQSNMEMPVKGFRSQPVENSLHYILDAPLQRDRIRMFDVENFKSYNNEQWDCAGGRWRESSTESVAETSAVAYFFALNISRSMDIPVGIITADWGGTRIEAWMPMSALRDILTEEQIKAKHDLHPILPTETYCGMIAPIRRFTARGFLWYQGEANLGYQSLDYLGDIDHYDVMMARMVEQWREDWGDKNCRMPFYYTMIAPYIYCDSADDTSLPLFIETQTRALSKIPNCGMATTSDLGEPTCIHPAKKYEVGERLAALALAQTYGMKGFEARAPQYRSHTVENGKIVLEFDNIVDGITPWHDQPVKGFEIAGEDRVFYPAEASKWQLKITVWSDKVKNPVAVRYMFHNFGEVGNVKNMYGVPLAPFRTDNWNDVK